ncbi:MAG: class SAM-dependent methyltransferase [Rhodospirillales bacterium]|nr:class SAM-dependent methyltransferase [Rhodospirillales bacterium]
MPDQASHSPDRACFLGHSEVEIARLIKQSALIRPITERLLCNAGIGRGMRVLDLGCGAGDVSMLVAGLVGTSGSVVGIDRSPQVLAIARQRAQVVRLQHVEFKEASVEEFTDPQPFDLVIGRYILVHQVNPPAFIRMAASFARAGGVVAFHEIGLHEEFMSLPCVPLWQQVGDWLLTALRAAMPHYDAGNRLVEHFVRAGLPSPNLLCETPIGGGANSLLYGWLAEALRAVLPSLEERGIVTAEKVAIETLEARLRMAVIKARSQVTIATQPCAWTTI